MAKDKNDTPNRNGEAKRNEAPAVTPEITPPGVVVTANTHGLSKPIDTPKNLPVVERLREAMKLSRDVPTEKVIAEAVERLAKG